MKKTLGFLFSVIGYLLLLSLPFTVFNYFKTTTTGFLSVHMIGSLLGYLLALFIAVGFIYYGNSIRRKAN